MEKRPINFYLPEDDGLARIMLVRAGHHIAQQPGKADVILFTGGHDVSPPLYGERPHPTTQSHLPRDLREVKLFKAIGRDIPKVGICRGAQFLNVMCGGSLWQNVNNHCGPHQIKDAHTKQLISATSTHHQMMRPPAHAKVLAWSKESTQRESDTEVVLCENANDWEDPEVVFFKTDKALCFQPHPEYDDHECRDYFFSLLDRFIFNRLKGS